MHTHTHTHSPQRSLLGSGNKPIHTLQGQALKKRDSERAQERKYDMNHHWLLAVWLLVITLIQGGGDVSGAKCLSSDFVMTVTAMCL
jgi:hypothetical protein